MFCTRCGTANPDEALFCVSCNAELKRPTSPQRPVVSTQPEYQLPGFSDLPQKSDLPYPGYQSTYSAPPKVQGSASGRAIASMVMSLAALVTCGPLLSVPGLILGKQELDAINAGLAPIAGETFAKIGFYGGIVVTILSCLWIVPVAFYWLTLGTM